MLVVTDSDAAIPRPREAVSAPSTALENLAALLNPRDYVTVLINREDRPPHLAVAHRRLPLTGEIYADANWYRWEWAERIARTTDPGAAARKVGRRLSAAPEASHE